MFSDRDRQKLAGVSPVLIERLELVFGGMAAVGFPMMATDGVRTLAAQQALFAQGRSQPGKIVTYADGKTVRSNHQVKADGFGHAADCCFIVNGRPSWDEQLPWRAYGELAKALGLKWGGDWKRPDKPHVEL